MGRTSGSTHRTHAVAAALALTVLLVASPAPVAAGQAKTFDAAMADLHHKNTKVRLRAVRTLKKTARLDTAVPLATAVLDSIDEVQLDAIAAELNIFLARKVTPSKRIGLLVEVRGDLAAEPLFSAGPAVLGPLRVPLEVPLALAKASLDTNVRVGVEALYAFGVLANDVSVADRPALLNQAGPLVAGFVGSPYFLLRAAAVRVVGEVWARRPGDPAIEETLGDAVIAALNDRDKAIRETAMWALGSMKYDRAVQALSDLFQYYRKGPLAEESFAALARIGHVASLPAFVAQLNGGGEAFRRIAIEGLARSGDRSRAASIQSSLEKEEDDTVRLAGHFANVLLSDGSVDAIVDALSRSRLRDQAFRYIRELAVGRSAAFGRRLPDVEPDTRLDVVEALGLSGDAGALPIVEPLAGDKDPEIAQAAARAVARLRPSAP